LLTTARFDADPVLTELEQLDPGRLECRQVGDQVVGRAVVRERFVPVLKQVFDQLASQQSPIEQLLYLHLYRHSYGEERNFCRLARQTLCKAMGFSVRRFNRALEGLVKKGHVRLLQRDRRGTLYRVLLPDEIAGQRPGNEVLLGRLRTGEASNKSRPTRLTAAKPALAPTSAAPSTAATSKRAKRDSTDKSHKVTPISREPTVGSVAEAVLAALPPRQRKAAALDILQELTGLMEEGASLPALADAAARFSRLSRPRVEDFAGYVRGKLGLEEQGV
jgi:hypothetical protein